MVADSVRPYPGFPVSLSRSLDRGAGVRNTESHFNGLKLIH